MKFSRLKLDFPRYGCWMRSGIYRLALIDRRRYARQRPKACRAKVGCYQRCFDQDSFDQDSLFRSGTFYGESHYAEFSSELYFARAILHVHGPKSVSGQLRRLTSRQKFHLLGYEFLPDWFPQISRQWNDSQPEHNPNGERKWNLRITYWIFKYTCVVCRLVSTRGMRTILRGMYHFGIRGASF